MNKSLQLKNLPISNLYLLERKPIEDSRGYFERLFCQEFLHQFEINRIEQINHTLTKKKGTVRGMHFQYPPFSEIKIVSCLKGKVFDIAIDLRPESSTFLSWHSEILSETNFKSMIIPQGFAHGFQTLTDHCELLYFHSAPFNSDYQGGIHPHDPTINIAWPLPVNEISDKDKSHQLITPAFKGIFL